MDVKREYYNRFIEVFYWKISYSSSDFDEIKNSVEAVKANQNYCLEVSRLITYGSKEVIDFIVNIDDKSVTGESINPKQLLLLIRKDLGMETLNIELELQLPSKVLIDNKLKNTRI